MDESFVCTKFSFIKNDVFRPNECNCMGYNSIQCGRMAQLSLSKASTKECNIVKEALKTPAGKTKLEYNRMLKNETM